MLGDTIRDGLGCGGITLGMARDDILAKLGKTRHARVITKTDSYYLDSGEWVDVESNGGTVDVITFSLPLLWSEAPSTLRTSKGVSLRTPFAKAIQLYGKPDVEYKRGALYTPQGLALGHADNGAGQDVVSLIIVFPPGKPPEFEADDDR